MTRGADRSADPARPRTRVVFTRPLTTDAPARSASRCSPPPLAAAAGVGGCANATTQGDPVHAHRHARLRRDGRAGAHDGRRAGVGDGDAAAPAQRRGHDPLRRRFRPVRRRPLRRGRAAGAAMTGSTSSTASRPRRARRRRACGPATTSGGTGGPGTRPSACPPSSARSPSRSCTARARSACRCGSSACARRTRSAATRSGRSCEFGISASKTTLRSSIAQDTLRVVVGTWTVLREDGALQPLEDGPSASGVYAEPRADGAQHRAARRARAGSCARSAAGAGLVAATRVGEDAARLGAHRHGRRRRRRGRRVRSASATLRNRFAVAVDGDTPVALPVAGGGALMYRRRASPLHAARAGVSVALRAGARRARARVDAPAAARRGRASPSVGGRRARGRRRRPGARRAVRRAARGPARRSSTRSSCARA